ncbi:MAG: hypothetical protein ABI572_12840 [Actinomycetota bacterium]
MGTARTHVLSTIAVGVVTAFALVSAPPALATRSFVALGGATLEGASPSTWDSAVGATGCAQTGFSPVADGTYKNRDDAFDNGLILAIGATPFDDLDGEIPGAPLAKEAIATADDATFPLLSVHRWDRVLPGTDTLRTLVRFQNNDVTTQALTVEWDSDLGSDGSTQVRGSSSGDASYTKADRWVVSSDNAVDPSDPALTWVLSGKRARVHVDNIVTALGNDQTCFTFDYSLSVPAGKTRYLMLFTAMSGKNEGALASAPLFDSVTAGSPLLAGIKASSLGKIANWDL